MLHGIDVSDYQTVDSFHALKSYGIDFCIAKATQGTTNVQTTFASYADRARSCGIVFGAYHFLDWHADPIEQAEHFLGVYKPRNGDLPPTLDCEACDVDATSAIIQIARFVREVEPHLDGAKMLLYMSYSFPQDHLVGGSGFSGHPLWVAAYENPDKGFADVTPAAWSTERVKLWQYSNGSGVDPLPGISNPVDRDVFNGSRDDLQAFTLRGLA